MPIQKGSLWTAVVSDMHQIQKTTMTRCQKCGEKNSRFIIHPVGCVVVDEEELERFFWSAVRHHGDDNMTDTEIVWVCGKCGAPTVGEKWTCQACGAGAGGATEGAAFRSPRGIVVVTEEEGAGA